MPLPGEVHLTECQPDPKDDQMSRGPDVVPFLATRCLYQGVHLHSDVPGTSENLNTNDSLVSRWPDVVLLLVTRCLYWGGYIWPTWWHTMWKPFSVICHLNCILENWIGNVCRLIFLFLLLLLLLFLLLMLLFMCKCASTITN